ncbi:uncharacterized protein RabX1 [Chironomus tepperi]|uniref:uncharacterized protein RabX1 n=1 Tax=Chironomus tepperi TaxID=113505 RepID=UPI00391F708E
MKAIEAKIVVLGSQGVGKTSLVAKYISDIYSKEIGPTIGASFFTCKINLNNVKVKMQLWDTAGQERFKAMAPMYYRNANAALLVFDVTNYTTFAEVKSWILELRKNVQEPMFLLLVGNKIDLEEERKVSREEALVYAQSIGAQFLETSVVQNQGIEQVFMSIGLGLINLSSESNCSSMKRYESKDSLLSTHSSMSNLSGIQYYDGVHMAIDISQSVEANDVGRIEVGPWERDAVAHGYPQKSGWCC